MTAQEPLPISAPAPDAIRQTVVRVREEAQAASRTRLVAAVARVPDFDLLRAFDRWSDAPDRFYWEQPALARAMLTRGCVRAKLSGEEVYV